MILQVYAVLDSAVGAYGQPFFSHTDDQASRTVVESARNSETLLDRYPEHFMLFHLASYDDITGVFTSNAAPVCLGSIVTLRQKVQNAG